MVATWRGSSPKEINSGDRIKLASRPVIVYNRPARWENSMSKIRFLGVG